WVATGFVEQPGAARIDPATRPAPTDSVGAAAAPTTRRESSARGTPEGGIVASPDPATWPPHAAIVLTGLSLPLAYWTGALVPAVLSKARASLPAPGPRPRSLLRESGG